MKPTGKLAGITEFAEMADVSRQRAHKLAQRDDFPAPLDSLSGGTRPIWSRPALARWLNKHRPWLGAIIALLFAFTVAAPAVASPPPGAEAGRFWREGMKGMYDIGLRLPLEGAAWMHIRGCQVSEKRAECRLAIKQQSMPLCTVRMILTHRHIAYPGRSWHCPTEWRPPEPYHQPTLDELRGVRAATASER